MKLRSTKPLRAAKGLYIALSAALCLMGLLLIIVPGFSVQLVGILCGAMLVAFGIVRLAGYFSKDLYRLAFQYDLTSGILLILLGIIMLCNPSSLMTVVCVVLGFFILTDGLFKIQIALDAKRFGLSKWFLILCACGADRNPRRHSDVPSRPRHKGIDGNVRHIAALRRNSEFQHGTDRRQNRPQSGSGCYRC